MKNAIFLIMIIMIWSCSNTEKNSESHDHKDHSAHTAETSGDSKPKSPKKMAMTNVGDNHVHIEYSSPSKRGRQIFGGLVAFGEVWVTGAHKATSIQFSTDVEVEGTTITAGKYALFTIPGEEEWTIIINKNWDQHLADEYDAADDIVRIKATPVALEEPVESLTYKVEELDAYNGKISISWDNVLVSFELKNSGS